MLKSSIRRSVGAGALAVLMLAGASPLEALSTNKVQGAYGEATAAAVERIERRLEGK